MNAFSISFIQPLANYLSSLPKRVWAYLRRRWNSRTTAIELISVLLMALFGLTALDKSVRFERFYEELGKSPFLMNYQTEVAWGTPILEGIVVIALAIGQRVQLWGLYVSVFLMSLFTGYIYLLLNYSYYTPCLCSAALESLTWEQHLVFNLAFLVLAVVATVLKEKQLKSIKENHKG